MMSQLKNRFSKKTSDNASELSEKLRSFLKNSPEEQKLFAEIYQKGIFDTKDESSLMEYVYSLLYFQEDVDFIRDELNEEKNKTEDLQNEQKEHTRQLCDKIIAFSKAHTSMDNIHLGCVWILYFDYLERKQKAVPVFKIYKENQESVVLDINLNFYNNWNAFLNSTEFPKSCLCFPTDGEYRFVNGKWDLKFLCIEKLGNGNSFNHFTKTGMKNYILSHCPSGFEKAISPSDPRKNKLHETVSIIQKCIKELVGRENDVSPSEVDLNFSNIIQDVKSLLKNPSGEEFLKIFVRFDLLLTKLTPFLDLNVTPPILKLILNLLGLIIKNIVHFLQVYVSLQNSSSSLMLCPKAGTYVNELQRCLSLQKVQKPSELLHDR